MSKQFYALISQVEESEYLNVEWMEKKEAEEYLKQNKIPLKPTQAMIFAEAWKYYTSSRKHDWLFVKRFLKQVFCVNRDYLVFDSIIKSDDIQKPTEKDLTNALLKLNLIQK
jgi:hypothetical protein